MSTSVAPQPALPPSVFLTPFSVESIGPELASLGTAAPTSAAYPASQSVFYYPFTLMSTITVYRFFWCNGTTASTNNFQVGVYNNAGTSIVLGTSTLATGASQPQFDNVADFRLSPGKYYMAIWCSGTTAHLIRNNPATATRFKSLGVFQQTSQAGGLPASITFTALANTYAPLFGLALRASP